MIQCIDDPQHENAFKNDYGFFMDDDYDASFDQQVDKLREENQMSNTDSDDDWSRLVEPPPAPKKVKEPDFPIRIIEKNYWDETHINIFEIAIGLSKREFIRRQLKLISLLGTSYHYSDGKSMWKSRKKWKKMMRVSALRQWAEKETTETAKKSHTLTFSKDIGICLIPPKEGEDFDIETVDQENCRDYNMLSAPVYPEECYSEFWAKSPFETDKGTLRPFYSTEKEDSKGWCLCKRPPLPRADGTFACPKCLNFDIRRFARKSTPEQFTKQYRKNLSLTE